MNNSFPKVVMAFDFGLKHIGIAIGQEITRTASTFYSINATEGHPDWTELDKIISEWKPNLFVVGDPFNMDGTRSKIQDLSDNFSSALKKRYDILIFNNNGLPELIVECKAPAIKINDDTLSQVLSYQKNIQANYLILTNGVSTYSLYINVVKKKVEFLDDIPSYNS